MIEDIAASAPSIIEVPDTDIDTSQSLPEAANGYSVRDHVQDFDTDTEVDLSALRDIAESGIEEALIDEGMMEDLALVLNSGIEL